MRIQFDPKQPFQLDAIRAVVDLFEGQPLARGQSEISFEAPAGLALTELGTANFLALDTFSWSKNLKAIQEKYLPAGYREIKAQPVYTVEMETGTGKTYVYLRTIYELHEKYGWSKFVIVVPSVAIREGVVQAIKQTKEHFEEHFGKVPLDSWVYDSKEYSLLRSFATGTALQILILNIQAFDREDNVIRQELDGMSGHRPLEFIQKSRPVVILDEPQNMGSEKRRSAIESLNPLIELRYSATHREYVNPVYRLDPVKAYDLGLVKQIEVSSVLERGDFNKPYIRLIDVKAKPISATIELDVHTSSGPRREQKKIQMGADSRLTDLYKLSGEREIYEGIHLEEIDAGDKTIKLEKVGRLTLGQTTGANTDDLMRVQIRETITQHFKKEERISLLPEAERMKVLSLFFIDRVANYAPADGKIRTWFTEEYQRVAAEFAHLNPLPVAQVHDGYFAQDKHGAKDSREERATVDDNKAYVLIMQRKELLLQIEEPLRFIFSHSALREGWDNPNVFQICTLRETHSVITKRQEIGRGMRLPVRADGTRCFDKDLNRLTIIANESYRDFSRQLQKEIRDECQVEFGDRVRNANETRRKIRLKENWQTDPNFVELWNRIRVRTRYDVRFETADLISKAASRVREQISVERPVIDVQRGKVMITYKDGVEVHETSTAQARPEPLRTPVPDILSYLQRETGLTRSTLAQILVTSGKLKDIATNPQQFMTQAVTHIRDILSDLMVDGIEYEKLPTDEYSQQIFLDAELQEYLAARLLPVSHSIYDELELDSETERSFAKRLDIRDPIKLFIKLPRAFKVETPIGTYNPDWAIVKQEDEKLVLVCESKGSSDTDSLRGSEKKRVDCGRRHFKALGVHFKVEKSGDLV